MTLLMHVAEHRSHPRIHCRLTGSIREMDSAGASETLGELRRMNSSVVIHNISLGGACIETEKPSEPGHIMRLEFTLPSQNGLEPNPLTSGVHRGCVPPMGSPRSSSQSPSNGVLATFAEVCWANGTKLGMRFLALPEKGTTNLRQFILRENVVHNRPGAERRKP